MNLGIVTWVLCPGSHLAGFLFGGFERKSIFKCIQVVGSMQFLIVVRMSFVVGS